MQIFRLYANPARVRCFENILLFLIRLNLLSTPCSMRKKMIGFEKFGSFGFLVLSSLMSVLDSFVLEVLVLFVLTSLFFS